jgi:hypothetical protein
VAPAGALRGENEILVVGQFDLWGGQFCPQPAFSRLWPPNKAAAAKIGRPTSQTDPLPKFSLRAHNGSSQMGTFVVENKGSNWVRPGWAGNFRQMQREAFFRFCVALCRIGLRWKKANRQFSEIRRSQTPTRTEDSMAGVET